MFTKVLLNIIHFLYAHFSHIILDFSLCWSCASVRAGVTNFEKKFHDTSDRDRNCLLNLIIDSRKFPIMMMRYDR